MSKPLPTPIRHAIEPNSKLQEHVKDGLGAVDGAHREYFDVSVRAAFEDSLEIDESLRSGREQENRWDYLLGHEATRLIVAVEPHSATNHEIPTVIKKREAARDQLRPHLRGGAKIASWLWVASGKVHFADTERARIRLDQAGIQFVGTRVMAKHLPPPAPPAKQAAGPSKRKQRAPKK